MNDLVIAPRFTFDTYAEGKLLSTKCPVFACDTAKALSLMYPDTIYSVWSLEDSNHAKHRAAFMNGKQQLSEVKIKTDNKWKAFSYRHEVPQKVLADQFAHLSEEKYYNKFFKYKGYWYHTSDFMRSSGGACDDKWDGYHGDSYFSGQLIKLSKDGEQYQVATYMS